MNDRGCCIRLCCLNIAIAIVAALFTFGLGLLLGAIFGAAIISFIASVAVFIAVMLVLLVILLILRACRRDNEGCFDR